MIVLAEHDAVRTLSGDVASRRASIRAHWLAWSLVVACSVIAGLTVLYATPFGTGTGWDEATYIGAARNLLAGRGLTWPWGVIGQPVTHFPPLFPVTLAALSLAGADPLDVARFLNAALRSVDLVLASIVAWRLAGNSPRAYVAPVVAGVLLLLSVQMEIVYAAAMSEPLFLGFLFGAWLLLARAINTRSTSLIIVSAVLAAAALLTRYVGLGLVLTAVLVLLSLKDWSWRAKSRAAAQFVAVACAPLGVWIVHNALFSNQLVGSRSIAWHPIPPEHLRGTLFTLLDWFIPSSIAARLVSPDGTISLLGGAVLICGGVAAGTWAWVRFRSAAWRSRRSGGALQKIVLWFCVVYTVCVLISISLFDDQTQLDSRILSPVYISIVLLISAAAPGVFAQHMHTRARRIAVAVGALALVTLYGTRTALVLQRAHVEGAMYSDLGWLNSPTMASVRQLPPDATLISNAPDAVYLLANRSSSYLPPRSETESIVDQLRDLERATGGSIVLAYFNDPNIGYRAPALANEIQAGLPFRMLSRNVDGAVYILDTSE